MISDNCQNQTFLKNFHSLATNINSCETHNFLEHIITSPEISTIPLIFFPSIHAGPIIPPITEIVISPTRVYAVYLNGFACAFDKFSGEFLCQLSDLPNTKVKTIYYNRVNQTLILICMKLEDDYNSLECEYYDENIIGKEGFLLTSKRLFENDIISSPGFIEFDENNKKILTKARVPPDYKVWSMQNYKLELHVSHPSIEEIRFSLGYLIFLHRPENNKLSIDVYDIISLTKTSHITIDLLPGLSFEFIELFNEFLLIKHKRKCIFVINLKTQVISKVAESEAFAPEAFIFLSEAHMFMTFQGFQFKLWTVINNTLTSLIGFDINIPSKAKVCSDLIYLSKDQRRLFVYTKSCAKGYFGYEYIAIIGI